MKIILIVKLLMKMIILEINLIILMIKKLILLKIQIIINILRKNQKKLKNIRSKRIL